MGAFANSALELAGHGLAVIPLGGGDGKVPRVTHANWKRKPGPEFVNKLSQQFPDANIGVLCGLSDVTVVDIDDPAVTDAMIARCGDTPLKTATPSGGVHLWYQHDGERSGNLRDEGLDVDIKATGGLVVAPPSIRSNTGKPYSLIEGAWSDLEHLPQVRVGSLPKNDNHGVGISVETSKGNRNKTLHSNLLRQARSCDDFDALLDVARSINESFLPPMTDTEVIKTARSAWALEESGKNWVGQEARAIISKSELAGLLQNQDAFVLLSVLRVSHGSRVEPFAVSSKSMASAGVIPGWGAKRYVYACRWLVKVGFLVQIYQGGSKRGDYSKYVFPPPKSGLPIKGSETAPNINKHLPPIPYAEVIGPYSGSGEVS